MKNASPREAFPQKFLSRTFWHTPLLGEQTAGERARAILLALVAGLTIGVTPLPGLAQRCTANCGSRQIQFTPGERVRVIVVNQTSSLVQVEQIYGTAPVALLPSQSVEVDPNFGTEPNASLVFWDETQLPLRAVLFRPETNLLRIEILPGGRPPGDRSVYIENDGKVKVF